VEMADYIDQFHNQKRRDSSLAIVPPTECEETHAPMLHLTDAQPTNGGWTILDQKKGSKSVVL
jgi:hypothetical protein